MLLKTVQVQHTAEYTSYEKCNSSIDGSLKRKEGLIQMIMSQKEVKIIVKCLSVCTSMTVLDKKSEEMQLSQLSKLLFLFNLTSQREGLNKNAFIHEPK